ncbi:ABC transporter permease [Ruegeria sp. 2012CJ41-6]|uniref:ABC transporter permease n=1 Tax=Ruegeria spongiae TaxID=2942209 RepID=A0ABT0Q2W7_9RHOB|nr:ABC transporter permease [Ruegeria spongiae]MCL6284165.1 ABC transporter permease [Ruegeria spongiae]
MLLFTIVFFATPITGLLFRAVHSPEYASFFPNSTEHLQSSGSFNERFYETLFLDIRSSDEARTSGRVARRLNQDQSGFITMVKRAVRASRSAPEDITSYQSWFLDLDDRWGEPDYQNAIRRAVPKFTDFYLLATLDMKRGETGGFEKSPENQAIFVNVILRTLWISFSVTMICVLLGYPVAWTMANASKKWRNILLLGVLFSFWTSLLVRTAAWVIVLQKEGPVNNALQTLGLIDAPLQLVFNRFGVYVALTHILLPFLIFPLYSVMVGIPKDLMRAAKSLGARPVRAFFSIYVPQTFPGLSAGAILVFVLSIGYYITPALVGGPKDQMLSYFIAFYTNNTINWGLAAALALNLLVVTLVLYSLYQYIIRDKRLRLGGDDV